MTIGGAGCGCIGIVFEPLASLFGIVTVLIFKIVIHGCLHRTDGIGALTDVVVLARGECEGA